MTIDMVSCFQYLVVNLKITEIQSHINNNKSYQIDPSSRNTRKVSNKFFLLACFTDPI